MIKARLLSDHGDKKSPAHKCCGGAKAAFPRSRHGLSSDHGQRGQGCAAPGGLDLDASARRGRKMTGVWRSYR